MCNEQLSLIASVLSATLRMSVPLGFAAIGGAISERSGIIALGLEGYMTIGAFFAVLGAYMTNSAAFGLLAGALAAGIFALIYGFVSIHLKAQQTVSGLGMNTIAPGLVAILMVLATLLAVWVNGKAQKRLNSVTLAAVFTPHIISLVSVSTVFLWIMDPQIGAINYVLRTLGLKPFPFLASSKTALASLVGMMVWKSLGYYSLLILAALQGVPKDIYEAAEIDDTPKIRTFFRITLPMISPTLFFTTIVATISSFQVFETVNLMTQGGPVNSTNTLVYQIYSDAFKYLKLFFLGKKVHYQ